jgi:L-ascorbate metabolism protein UlaG (beta-lactamase superfamily)
MTDKPLQLAPDVHIEPMAGDYTVDCRLLFIGDRHRQLVRAYAEAIHRLSRPCSMAQREAFLRASAEVTQFYEVTSTSDRIALRMKDEYFREAAPLDEIDLSLVARRGAAVVRLAMPLTAMAAVGRIVPMLRGTATRAELLASIETHDVDGNAAWAREVLDRWIDAGFVQQGVGPSIANRFSSATAEPRVTFMGHTSIMLRSRDTVILTDPLYRVSLGIPPFAFDAARLPLAAIFLTHSHWDHCDLATLLHFDKRTPIVIPRIHRPTAFNPPMVPALRALGFNEIRELDVWETTTVGDVQMMAVPFHGEQDEPDAEIDHYTYVFRAGGLTLYGGVDAYRDTYGEMRPALERVRREWAPDVAFLPISRMTYEWRHGGVNGFCRYVDTERLEQSFQYTAGPEQALEWALALGVRRVIPYATFNFTPFDVPAQAAEFDAVLNAAGAGNLLLPLRPFDSAGPADLSDASHPAVRRRYLKTVLRAGAAARRLDRRFAQNLGYRLVKRILQRRAPQPAAHHH